MRDVDTPRIGEGEVLVKVESAGINFIDTYQRSGLNRFLPSTLGLEAAGTVVEADTSVTGLNIGDRVAYTNVAGAYAEFAVVAADKLVPIPAASVLTRRRRHVRVVQRIICACRLTWLKQETAVSSSGCWRVGLLLIQMVKMLGGTVIGTVSTEAKAELPETPAQTK